MHTSMIISCKWWCFFTSRFSVITIRFIALERDIAHFPIIDSVFCLWLCEASRDGRVVQNIYISLVSFLSGSENHKGLSFRLWVCPGPQNCVHLRGHGKTKAQNYLVQGWQRIVWPSLPTCKYITQLCSQIVRKSYFDTNLDR